MLSQSASQTANLFQAIDRNTQQMFANKFNVQQAQTSLAINTIQQMEQSRMNDARIAALNLEMRQREQDMVLQQRAMDLDARLAPLKEQAERSRLQSAIQTSATASINPQFDDLKPEIANVIFDNPEIADEIQQEYTKTLNQLGQDSLKPNVDIVSRVNEEKKRLRDVVEKKKLESQKTKDAKNKSLSGWLLGKIGREAPQDYDVGRAASIYESFGGNRDQFNLKNDKNTQDMIDSAVRIARVTGKIDPALLSRLPVRTQIELVQIAENKEKKNFLIEQAKSIRENIRSVNTSIGEGDNTPETLELLKVYQGDLRSITNEINRLSPIDDEDTAKPKVDEIRERGAASAASILIPESKVNMASKEELQYAKAKSEAVTKISTLRSLNLPLPEKIIGKKDPKTGQWTGGYLNPDQGFSDKSLPSRDFSQDDILNLLDNPKFKSKLESAIKADEAKRMDEFGSGDSYSYIMDRLIKNPEKYDLSERKDAINKVASLAPWILNELASGR